MMHPQNEKPLSFIYKNKLNKSAHHHSTINSHQIIAMCAHNYSSNVSSLSRTSTPNSGIAYVSGPVAGAGPPQLPLPMPLPPSSTTMLPYNSSSSLSSSSSSPFSSQMTMAPSPAAAAAAAAAAVCNAASSSLPYPKLTATSWPR